VGGIKLDKMFAIALIDNASSICGMCITWYANRKM